MARLLSAALSLCLLAAGPNAPAPPDTKAKVDAVFRDFDRSDSPGCALGVYRDGQIVHTRGYGMANLELGVANSPETVFDIGSTSKQFTAFSIHLLAREGRLSLDDDIRKWVPEVPDYGTTITIRHLLHHTSGLRDYIELMSLQGVLEQDLATDADALAILSRQRALNFRPGDEHLYSNTGYFLLSVIVRRASGQSLRDFAAERIFAPLGMRHTQFNDSYSRIITNRATGYGRAEAGGFRIAMGDWEQTGDGAVQTTVEDLQRWDQNFYDPKVGDRALIEAMLWPGVLNSGKTLTYASALQHGTYRGLPTVSHGGAWVGYRAQLLRFPGQKLSVACLCNLAEANPSQLARQVAEIYLGDRMEGVPDPTGTPSARAAVAPQGLEKLAGFYRDPSTGEVVEASVREAKLVARTSGTRYVLSPQGPNRFSVDGLVPPERGEVEFVAVARAGRPQMRITIVDEDGSQERTVYDPVPAWKPPARDIAELAGTYGSNELDTTWRLAVENGQLVVRHRGIPDKPLQPTVADTFGLGGMSLHFVRDAAGKVTGFTLDEGRVRGVAFARMPAG